MFKPLSSKLAGTFAAFAAFAILALSGCKQDGDTITVNTPSTKQNAKVTYVIQVMEANGGSGSASAAIQGATLRYFNPNAAGGAKFVDHPAASDANGNIILTGIQPGSFSGSISSPNYGSIDFVADLSKGGADTAYTAISRIHMFPKTAALTGKVYGNYQMNNAVPNPNAATDVRQVEMMLSYTLIQNGNQGYPMGNGPGRLVNVDLNPMNMQVTQDEGPTSAFVFENTYSTESGMIQATLSMIPKRFTSSGAAPKDSIFTLAGGNPRNNIRVNLYRAANGDDITNLGNLLAKPTTQP